MTPPSLRPKFVRKHKARVAEELGERLQNAGVARPDRLSRTLLILLDGATVHAVLSSDAPRCGRRGRPLSD